MGCGDTIGQNISNGIKVTHADLGLCVGFCTTVGVPHKPCVFDETWIRRAQNIEKMLFQQSIPLRLSTLARCFCTRFTFLIDAAPASADLGVEARHTSASVIGFKFSWCTLIPLAESVSRPSKSVMVTLSSDENHFHFYSPQLLSISGLTHSSIVSRAKAMYSESVSISINW